MVSDVRDDNIYVACREDLEQGKAGYRAQQIELVVDAQRKSFNSSCCSLCRDAQLRLGTRSEVLLISR